MRSSPSRFSVAGVLLKMLIGLLRPDRGTILFDGQDVTKMKEGKLAVVRQRIAMLFQGAALFDSLTVGENVAYGLEEHFRDRMIKAERVDRVAWALELVDLPGIEGMRVADFIEGRAPVKESVETLLTS